MYRPEIDFHFSFCAVFLIILQVFRLLLKIARTAIKPSTRSKYIVFPAMMVDCRNISYWNWFQCEVAKCGEYFAIVCVWRRNDRGFQFKMALFNLQIEFNQHRRTVFYGRGAGSTARAGQAGRSNIQGCHSFGESERSQSEGHFEGFLHWRTESQFIAWVFESSESLDELSINECHPLDFGVSFQKWTTARLNSHPSSLAFCWHCWLSALTASVGCSWGDVNASQTIQSKIRSNQAVCCATTSLMAPTPSAIIPTARFVWEWAADSEFVQYWEMPFFLLFFACRKTQNPVHDGSTTAAISRGAKKLRLHQNQMKMNEIQMLYPHNMVSTWAIKSLVAILSKCLFKLCLFVVFGNFIVLVSVVANDGCINNYAQQWSDEAYVSVLENDLIEY